METPKTEYELIKGAIIEASQLYKKDIPTNEVGNESEFELSQLNKLTEKLHSDLFEWRDKQPVRPLHRPVLHELDELFRELKFGRHGSEQDYLNKCIDGLKDIDD